jgi:metal-responsive CopG/Arc/MetJ family transcriptional regulator
MEHETAKVTISLPAGLLALADTLAREQGTSRSAVIAKLLEREEEARIQALMAEGYREMAEESLQSAREMEPLVDEMLRHAIEWDESAHG